MRWWTSEILCDISAAFIAASTLRRHLVRIGGAARPVERDIAGRFRPHLRGAGLDRLAQIGDGIERLVFDLDELGAVLRGGLGLGDHHGDGFADMAHALAGQRRPERHDQLGAAAPADRRMHGQVLDACSLDIVRRDDGDHALHRQRRVRIDAFTSAQAYWQRTKAA